MWKLLKRFLEWIGWREKTVVVKTIPQKPRTQIKKRPKPRYCAINGKREYSELEAKRRAKEKSNTYLRLRAYCCPFETHWHLTHQRQRLSMKSGRSI